MVFASDVGVCAFAGFAHVHTETVRNDGYRIGGALHEPDQEVCFPQEDPPTASQVCARPTPSVSCRNVQADLDRRRR